MADEGISLKTVVVGNAGVGKTALLTNWKSSGNGLESLRGKLQEFSKPVNCNGQDYQLTCVDTQAVQDERMRPLTYPGTNVFLICFSYADPASLESVNTQWVKELTHHCSECPTPFFLVGLCADAERKVTDEEVKAVVAKQNATITKIQKTFTVSVKNREGLETLFDAVAQAAADHYVGLHVPAQAPVVPVAGGKRKQCTLF